jgi:two-component system, OmpR family, sensor kinase
MKRRSGLQSLLVRRVALVGMGLMIALNVALGALIHHQIHQQVDLLLLHLASAEAHLSINELSQGLHVHDSKVSISALGGATTKHAMALGSRCEVLSATEDLQGFITLPAPWCRADEPVGTRRTFFMDNIAGLDLRAASTTVRLPDGRDVTFIAAVDHRGVDASTWSLVAWSAGASLLLVLLLVAAMWTVTQRLTRDLRRLESACDGLHTESLGRKGGDTLAAEFRVAPSAPQELQALSTTLGGLITRLHEVLSAQDHFVAEAAHELRTPLTALRGELEVTLRRERSAAEYEEAIRWVMGDVDQLTSLANDLLDLARGRHEELRAELMRAEELLEEGIERTHRAAQGLQVTVRWGEGARERMVCGEPGRAARVMENLARNAALHAHARTLEVEITADDVGLVVEIADDGVGISAELAPRLFSPFQRGEGGARAQGHGLGLSIAAELMRAQGGALTHVPTPRGARWRLRWSAQTPGRSDV